MATAPTAIAAARVVVRMEAPATLAISLFARDESQVVSAAGHRGLPAVPSGGAGRSAEAAVHRRADRRDRRAGTRRVRPGQDPRLLHDPPGSARDAARRA